MKHIVLFILGLTGCYLTFAQRNCNALLWNGDQCGYEACKFLEESPKFFQLRKEFHDTYDKAVEICPDYADAYRAKSVAYLKTGDFVTWKILMDKAVALAPEENLGYRGWCRYQFFRDYTGAIADIEKLEKLVSHDIGYSQNGTYHLKVAKALCHKQMGNTGLAISLLKDHIDHYEGGVGIYDFMHLGVLYLESGDYELALDNFQSQMKEYDCAENRYYLAKALVNLKKSDKAREHFEKAKEYYSQKRYMFDPYTHQTDKVYAKDIESAFSAWPYKP